jgi:hypothetical protein
MECFSLPPDAARRALRQFPNEDDLYAWLGAELEKAKPEVRLEKLSLVKVRGGKRCKVEELDEVPYTSEYTLASIPQTVTIGATLPDAPKVIVTNDVTPPPAPPAPPKTTPAPPPGAKGETGAKGEPGTGSVLAPGAVPARLFPPWPYTPCTPKSFSSRNTGWTTELDVAPAADGRMYDVSMKSDFIRYRGTCDFTSGEQRKPVFDSSRINTRILAKPGKHNLAGTMNPSVNTGIPGENTVNRTWLVFLTLSSTEISVGPPVEPSPSAVEFQLRFDLISLPPLAAHRALLTHPREPDLYEWLDAELARKDSGVSLEQTSLTHALSGQRVKVDSGTGYPFAGSVDSPQVPQSLSIGTTAPLPTLPAGAGTVFPPWPMTSASISGASFRDLGSSLEMELNFADDSKTLDMNLAASVARLGALLPQGVTGDIVLPVIECRKGHAYLYAVPNKPVLAGTLNRPAGTGAPGGNTADRVCLLFVTATLPQ